MALKETETPKRVPLRVVESGANTFTAQLILLPNNKGENVFDLDQVELIIGTPAPAAAADHGSIQVQIQLDTGTTPTTMLDPNDQRVKYDSRTFIESAVEAADIANVSREVVGEKTTGFANYIANDQFWLCTQGTAMGGVTAPTGWAIGSVEKLSSAQLLALNTSQVSQN